MGRLARVPRSATIVIALSVSGIGVWIAPSASAKTVYTFEECDEGWTAEERSSSPTPTSKWHRSEPGDGSATAFYNGPPYAGSDSISDLISPVHAWGGGKVTVSFAIKYNYEPAATRATEEGIHFEWSRDGKIWTEVAFFGETSPSYPAFEQQKLSFHAPRGPLQIRFQVLSDALVEFTGGAVDNIALPMAKPKSAAC